MGTVAFGPFRLDPAQRLLTRPGGTVSLRPKTLRVLLLLLERTGEVVSKADIMATVWDGVTVSDYVLTTCISELRAALGDRGREPRFVRTVHRTGYRLTLDEAATAPIDDEPSVAMVGRDRELAQLHAALERSRTGRRQIVFVTGEMGIGKTTLANHFVASSGARDSLDLLVARGQCVERFGAGEAYMPVLEAVGRLGRGPDGSAIVATLRRHAPAWLAQLPGLLPPEERAELRRDTPAQTQESMLRQVADGLEALGEARTLLLLLEDLHLGDHATLELIASLALRVGPVRLMLLGTFRDAEPFPASSAFHRLQQQLLLHRQCDEIALAPLTADAIGAYLTTRFPGVTPPPGLASTIRRRTEGNPLFVARLLDHLVEDDAMTVDRAAGVVSVREDDVARSVPGTLRTMIEQRTDGLLAEERDLLEAASVAGVQFWSAAVAAAVGRDREDVERCCAQLGRHHGLLVAGPGDDDAPIALGASHGFSHALYQQALYERIEPTRRRRLHDAIGMALRGAWGARASEIAADLASHFEGGAEPARAVEFLDEAAAVAVGRGAHREAVGYLDRALALLSGDDARRLDLLMTRGPAALATSGYASVDVHDNYRRALELARRLGNPMREMSCLVALATCQQTRGNLADSEALAVELVRTGERLGMPAPILAQLHNPLSQVRMYQGAVQESVALADAAVAAMQVFPLPAAPPDQRPALWADASVMLHCQHGAASFAAGRFAQAATAVDEALRIARTLEHPFNQASACTFAALYEDTSGRWDRAIAVAQEAIDTAVTYDFPFWRGIAQIFCGHAMACGGDVQGGLSLLRDGIATWRGTGAKLATSNHLNLLADVLLRAGDVAGARAALDESEAHAVETGEHVFMAETHRLQAQCRGDGEEAYGLLRRAVDIARRQGTTLWALRASLALHRLRASTETRRELEEMCRCFDAEPETRDVAAARAALAG